MNENLTVKPRSQEVGYHLLDRVTLSHAIYAVIILAAALLRFSDLGQIPFSPEEAAEAAAVWSYWNPGHASGSITSPLYFSFNLFLSQLIGFSDVSMRMVPALFGLALVSMPWFLRRNLGTIGALLAAGFIALSPVHVLISRTAGGQSAALFAAMLIFVAWFRFHQSSDNRWLYAMTIGLGFGVISASIFFSLLLSLILAWMVKTKFGRSTFVGADSASSFRELPRFVLIRCLLLFAAFVLLGSTAILFNLQGFGISLSLFTDWLQLFAISGDALELLAPVLILGRYEQIILLFGVAAAVWAILRNRSFPTLLTYWLLFALILTFFQGGYVYNVLLLSIPGVLLVGAFLSSSLKKPVDLYQLLLIGLIVTFSLIILINFARYARLLTVPGSMSFRYNILLAIILAVIMAVAILLTWNWDERAAIQSLTISSLILLVVLTWGNAWWLSRSAANDTRERLVSQAGDDGLVLLQDAVTEVSWQLKNSGSDLKLASTIDSPLLEWYLRDLENFETVSTLSRDMDSDALITGSNLEPQLEDAFFGSEFGYLRPDTSHLLDAGAALRWWLFHQSPIPVNEEKLILWIRADLVEEG